MLHSKRTGVQCLPRQTNSHSLVLQNVLYQFILVTATCGRPYSCSMTRGSVKPADIAYVPQTLMADVRARLGARHDGGVTKVHQSQSLLAPSLLHPASSRHPVNITQGPRGKRPNRTELRGDTSFQVGDISSSWGAREGWKKRCWLRDEWTRTRGGGLRSL